jgi:uncharacterized DUF497 family protein
MRHLACVRWRLGGLQEMAGFDWDRANIEHIAKHGVTPAEAEQVVLNDPVDLTLQLRDGEERTPQIGETNAGRILVSSPCGAMN